MTTFENFKRVTRKYNDDMPILIGNDVFEIRIPYVEFIVKSKIGQAEGSLDYAKDLNEKKMKKLLREQCRTLVDAATKDNGEPHDYYIFFSRYHDIVSNKTAYKYARVALCGIPSRLEAKVK